MATRTFFDLRNFAVSFQYGSTRSFHCHASISGNSGGQDDVIQLGWVAFGSPPGQPEKVMTCATPSFDASSTVSRKTWSCAFAVFAFGWIGLPWQLSALIVRPRRSIASLKAFSFLSFFSSSAGLQCASPGYA